MQLFQLLIKIRCCFVIEELLFSEHVLKKSLSKWVMNALSNAICEALTDGKIVRIDSLGSFQLTLKATGSPEPTVRGKSLIKENKIVFKPSKRLKARVAKATYEQLK